MICKFVRIYPGIREKNLYQAWKSHTRSNILPDDSRGTFSAAGTAQKHCLSSITKYSPYRTHANNRRESCCELMSPHASPSGHGSHYLYTFKTNPLKVWIVEPLVGQNLSNKLLGLVYSLIKRIAWLLGNMCSTYRLSEDLQAIYQDFQNCTKVIQKFAICLFVCFSKQTNKQAKIANNSHTKLVDISTILFIGDEM